MAGVGWIGDTMSNDKAPAPAGDGGQASTEVEVLSPKTAEVFRDMIVQLPVEDGSQATDRIVAQLLAATDADGLNAPFESDGTAKRAGLTLVIYGVKILKSAYEGGVGAFMRLEAIDANDATDQSFTTGSMSIMAQITAAYVRELLPVRAVVARADRPTAAGFYPYQLRVLATRVSVERVRQAASA